MIYHSAEKQKNEKGCCLRSFQYRVTEKESYSLKSNPDKLQSVKEESADVFLNLLRFADMMGIDLLKEAERKIKVNGLKYPVEKARGSAKKYTEL